MCFVDATEIVRIASRLRQNGRSHATSATIIIDRIFLSGIFKRTFVTELAAFCYRSYHLTTVKRDVEAVGKAHGTPMR